MTRRLLKAVIINLKRRLQQIVTAVSIVTPLLQCYNTVKIANIVKPDFHTAIIYNNRHTTAHNAILL